MLKYKFSHILSTCLFIIVSINVAFSSEISPKPKTPAADLVKIPDAKFLAYLKAKIPGAFVGDEMNIKSEEVTTLTRINVLNKKVIDFKGIEYFTALEEFNCTYNLAATLDLSKNINLKYLVVWENRLTSLDLSKNKELLVLNCGDNQITSLNISGSPKLKELYCEYNQLPALNLSNNKELSILYCNNNKITALDLSKNVKLQTIENVNNPLNAVVKNNIMLEIPDQNFRQYLKEKIPNAFVGNYLNTKHNDVVYLKNINIADKGISSLQGISNFKGLEKLNCSNNKLSTLDLSENTALTNLNFDNNPLTFLDLRGVRSIDYLTDLSANTSITKLNLHAQLRDDAKVRDLKQKRGKALTISVYGASAGSTNYLLINSNDIPLAMDNRYKNSE